MFTFNNLHQQKQQQGKKTVRIAVTHEHWLLEIGCLIIKTIASFKMARRSADSICTATRQKNNAVKQHDNSAI